MKTYFKKRKAQEFSFGMEVLPTIFAAVVTIAIAIWLVSLIFNITNDLNTNQQIRDSISYGAALIGNEQLAFVDTKIRRGVLDAKKLDDLVSKGCTGLNFRYAEYSLIVTDRDNNNFRWIICDEADTKITLPVAIYKDGEVHKGVIIVGAQKQRIQ